MSYVAAGVAITSLTVGAYKAHKAKKARKQQEREINNAPKYQISQEALDNQALAKGEAFGKDRAIQMQEQKLDQDTSNSISSAKEVTSSTSGLLSTIAAISANKDTARRGLAMDEAQLMNQKKAQLMNVNSQMIDEQDKAWNYNKNMPYQMRIAMLRDKAKAYDEQSSQAFATGLSSASNINTSGFKKGGGK